MCVYIYMYQQVVVRGFINTDHLLETGDSCPHAFPETELNSWEHDVSWKKNKKKTLLVLAMHEAPLPDLSQVLLKTGTRGIASSAPVLLLIKKC